MAKRRARRPRTPAVPDILTMYWQGLPPPDGRDPEPDDHELIVGACWFGEGKPKGFTPPWRYHPFSRAWLEWARPADISFHLRSNPNGNYRNT